MSILTAVCASPPSQAQGSLTAAQCRDARAVALATLKKYSGKISAALAKSFGRFSETCDLSTKFDTVPGTADDDAFGEFRVKMTVIRSS
jgi:hypothetical protein